MVFVPDHEHDVFISYSHIDDRPLPGEQTGWVTTLIQGLETRLAQILGTRDLSIWMDRQLSRNIPITPQIIGALEKTATLLIILSPGYVNSEWCRKERRAFLELVKDRQRSGSRSFVVELGRVENGDRPGEFQELIGYRFWEVDQAGRSPRILGSPKPDTADYYARLNDLCYELARELERLRESAIKTNTSARALRDRKAIFLAEVTDDLDAQRDDVKRYLDQAGLQVLPNSWYPRAPADFQEAMKRDLDKCELFVQLLSGAVGKISPDLPQGYARLQLELARKARKHILQWRHPNLELDTISDIEHCAFLKLDTVLAVGIEDFKREVKRRAFYTPSPPSEKSANAFIFVDRELTDFSLADSVCRALRRYGAEYALPLNSGTPSELRRDLEENLLYCDGIIIVYGDITVRWVREQLRQCRKIVARRKHPLTALAVYEGPPEPKEPLNLELHNMQIINCPRGLCEPELEAFLNSIQAEVN